MTAERDTQQEIIVHESNPKTVGEVLNVRNLPEVSYESVVSVMHDRRKKAKFGNINLAKNSDVSFLQAGVESAQEYLNIKSYDEEDGSEKYILNSMYKQFLVDYFTGHEDSFGYYNGALMGVGFVFSAFDHDQKGKLKGELRQLIVNPDTHDLLGISIYTSLSDHEKNYTFSERNTYFNRANPIIHIPSYQLALKSGIECMAGILPNTPYAIEDGAISAYRTLEKLWPYMDLDARFAA